VNGTGQGADPRAGLAGRLRDRFDVFHVPEALGSPYVPTPEFVRDYQIRSALALGAVLDSGGPEHPDLPGVRNTSLYTALLYSRVRIPPETATHFRTLAAAIRLALTPLLSAPLFSPEGGIAIGPGPANGAGHGVVVAPGGAPGGGANGHRPSVTLSVPTQSHPPGAAAHQAETGDKGLRASRRFGHAAE